MTEEWQNICPVAFPEYISQILRVRSCAPVTTWEEREEEEEREGKEEREEEEEREGKEREGKEREEEEREGKEE